jgi:uncharacterized protein (TIGR02246 family)
MNADERIVSDLLGDLEKAWNAGDGERFAQPFAEDADFVNIRGEHFRTREAIARGHQAIFDTIYKGSVVGYQLVKVRPIVARVLMAHVRGALKVPTGPFAGELRSLFTMVLTQDQNGWHIAAFHNTLVV